MTIISWIDLLWCLIPVILVSIIYVSWQGKPSEILYAAARMAVQLIAVGYVLVSIFENPSPWISLIIVSMMMVIAAWISIRPVKEHSGILLPAIIALGSSVFLHLFISIVFVLNAESWFHPQLLIPLAGMYFANTMNAISLAAERYHSELKNGQSRSKPALLRFMQL